MNNKELLKLKAKVDAAQESAQQLKGRKKELLAQLKEDFDCSNSKEAKQKRKQLEKEKEALEIKLAEKIKIINEKYNGTD